MVLNFTGKVQHLYMYLYDGEDKYGAWNQPSHYAIADCNQR